MIPEGRGKRPEIEKQAAALGDRIAQPMGIIAIFEGNKNHFSLMDPDASITLDKIRAALQ